MGPFLLHIVTAFFVIKKSPYGLFLILHSHCVPRHKKKPFRVSLYCLGNNMSYFE